MPYKSDKDRRIWQKERRKKWKKRLIEMKVEHGSCDQCGWDKYPEILHLHHRKKEEKKFSFSRGGIGNYTWERILREIEKCDFLCPNCHVWLHYNEKEWFKNTGNKKIEFDRKQKTLEG